MTKILTFVFSGTGFNPSCSCSAVTNSPAGHRCVLHDTRGAGGRIISPQDDVLGGGPDVAAALVSYEPAKGQRIVGAEVVGTSYSRSGPTERQSIRFPRERG